MKSEDNKIFAIMNIQTQEYLMKNQTLTIKHQTTSKLKYARFYSRIDYAIKTIEALENGKRDFKIVTLTVSEA